MTIPPAITLCANSLLFTLMILRRAKTPYLWLIMLPTMIGTLLLKWNDAQFSFGNLGANAYDIRLRNSQLTQIAFELCAVVLLWWGFRFRRRVTNEAEAFLCVIAFLHMTSRAGLWVDYMKDWPVNQELLFQAQFWNLAMIATLYWALFCVRARAHWREHGRQEA